MLSYIEIENKPGGYADCYINHQCVKRFEGKDAIVKASEYIDKIQLGIISLDQLCEEGDKKYV